MFDIFDLGMPYQPRGSRGNAFLGRRASALLVLPCFLLVVLCFSLAGCAGTKKRPKIDSRAIAPPTAASKAAAPPAAVPGTGILKAIVSRLMLAPRPLDVKASIAPNANNDSPVELDVVLIKDKALWKTAPSMTAKDWFAQKQDLERRYRNKLIVSFWEWVPGQPIEPIVIRVPRRLNGAMVFANYPTPGSHSAPIPKGGKVAIVLKEDDFTLEIPK